MNKLSLVLLALTVASAVGGKGDKVGTDDCDLEKVYYSAVIPFSILAMLCGIVSIVLGCMPACCGKGLNKLKVYGWTAIICGILGILLPAIGGLIGAGGVADAVCDIECRQTYETDSCTDAEKDQFEEDIAGLGIFFAYITGLGFIGLITGIVGVSVGSAALCKCCKAKAEPAPGGVVVATPAAAK